MIFDLRIEFYVSNCVCWQLEMSIGQNLGKYEFLHFLNLVFLVFTVFSSFCKVLTYLERCGKQFPQFWCRSGPYWASWCRAMKIWVICLKIGILNPNFSGLVEGICYFWPQNRILHAKILLGHTSICLETSSLVQKSKKSFFAKFWISCFFSFLAVF